MAATRPSPADVLAAVAHSRQDDGRCAVRALLMLYPTAGPWRSALPQVERLLAGRPGRTLLSAFAEVPAKAVRMLVKRRAIDMGLTTAGVARPDWLDRLDASEANATQLAGSTAQTLRRGKDIDAVALLLAQIVVAPTARRRALFDTLASMMATELGAAIGKPALVLMDNSGPEDDAELLELVELEVKDLLTHYDFPNDQITGARPPEDTAESPADEGMADSLTDEHDAAGADDRRTMAEPPPEPATEPVVVPRRLQVQVSDTAANVVRSHAFRPGAQHTVAVTLSPDDLPGHLIGPSLNEKGVVFSTPDDGGPDVAALTVQFVCDAFGQTITTSQPITLPRTGPSTTATFNLIVDAAATTVTCSVLLFQGAALLQSALITGPVSARDRAVAGAALRIVADGEFVAVVGPAPALTAHPVQSSVSTHVGHPGEALVVGDEGRAASVVSMPGASVLRAQITDALRTALDADSLSATAAGRKRAATAQVRLMRSLAKFGNLLYQDLPASVQALGSQQSVQLICGSDDIVPFEIVYDYGYPKANATLCPGWKQALHEGTCSCRPVDGEVATICPLGFWGLRLVIERQVADSGAMAGAMAAGLPSPGRTTLRPMDRVLFAASQKVDSAPGDEKASAIVATVAVLTERLGKANVAYVKTWPTWRRAVERTQPGLILSLPHNDRDADDLPRLEIGRGKLLSVGALDRSYVLGADPAPDQVGPVVFLLGCNTANEALPWYSAASAFRRRGAAVVVGTLSEALGRQTAPMTRLLADLLWGAPGIDPVRAQSLGDIMLLIRRRLVAEGMTLGMSLVAFGHAGWMLSPATPPTPPTSPGR